MKISRMLLLGVHVLLAVTGVVFLFIPSMIVDQALDLPILLTIWSVFFIVGGTTAALAIYMRSRRPGVFAFGYFEVAGTVLSVISCVIYGYAIIEVAHKFGGAANYAAGIFDIAFALSLTARILDTSFDIRDRKRLLRNLDKSTRP